MTNKQSAVDTPTDSTPRTPKSPNKVQSAEDLNKQSTKKKKSHAKKRKSIKSEADEHTSKPKWRTIELGSDALPVAKISAPKRKSKKSDRKSQANKFPIFTVTQTSHSRGEKRIKHEKHPKTPPQHESNESDGEEAHEHDQKDEIVPKDSEEMPDNVQKLIEALLPNNALQPGLTGAALPSGGQQVQQAGNFKVIYINHGAPKSQTVPQLAPTPPPIQPQVYGFQPTKFVPEEQYVNLNQPSAPAQDEQYANLAPPPNPLPSIQVPQKGSQKGSGGIQSNAVGPQPVMKPLVMSRPRSPSPYGKKHH